MMYEKMRKLIPGTDKVTGPFEATIQTLELAELDKHLADTHYTNYIAVGYNANSIIWELAIREGSGDFISIEFVISEGRKVSMYVTCIGPGAVCLGLEAYLMAHLPEYWVKGSTNMNSDGITTEFTKMVFH